MITTEINMEYMKNRIKEIIDAHCYPNEDGGFEIYKHYDDELSDETIIKCSQCNNPVFALEDMFADWEYDYACEYGEPELLKEIKYRLDYDELDFYKEHEDEIRDYICENYYWYYDMKDWNRYVEVNIMVDTGNCNYDFTCDNVLNWYGTSGGYGSNGYFDDNSSMKWLAKTQGKFQKLEKETRAVYKHVTGEDENNNYLNRPQSEDKFISSCIQELENISSHMSTITFLVSMPIFEFFKLKETMKIEAELNKSYNAEERKGTGYIVLDKSVMCGLFDPWQGGGSVLEIELERDVKLPIKYIFDATVDGEKKYGYDVDEVYGLVGSCWSDVVKEIHTMTDEEIEKAKG